jgi:hypothetical protein
VSPHGVVRAKRERDVQRRARPAGSGEPRAADDGSEARGDLGREPVPDEHLARAHRAFRSDHRAEEDAPVEVGIEPKPLLVAGAKSVAERGDHLVGVAEG